jgi:FkbM family methyltransferase
MTYLRKIGRRTADLLGHDSGLIRLLRPAYNLLLDVSTNGRGITCRFHGGETIRVDPWLRHHFPEEKDPEVFAYLKERVYPGSVCLNVGAHVGIFTLGFALWSGPGGRVLAFEPNPSARAVLERHVRLNGVAGRVEIMPFAVSNAPGEIPFFANGIEGTSRLGRPNPDLPPPADPPRPTKVVTLDGLCAERGIAPDWLLIDVEGYEIRVLAGSTAITRARQGGLGILVELHPNLWESAGSSRQELEAWIGEMRLKARPLSGQRDFLNEHGVVALEPLGLSHAYPDHE